MNYQKWDWLNERDKILYPNNKMKHGVLTHTDSAESNSDSIRGNDQKLGSYQNDV